MRGLKSELQSLNSQLLTPSPKGSRTHELAAFGPLIPHVNAPGPLSPKPETPNPKPQTLIPKPQTLNRKP